MASAKEKAKKTKEFSMGSSVAGRLSAATAEVVLLEQARKEAALVDGPDSFSLREAEESLAIAYDNLSEAMREWEMLWKEDGS